MKVKVKVKVKVTRRTNLGILLTEVGNLSGLFLAFHCHYGVTRIGGATQTEDFDRDTRSCFFDMLAILVQHGADTPILQARQYDIALLQGALLNQQ